MSFVNLASTNSPILSIAPELKQTLNRHVQNISKGLHSDSPGYVEDFKTKALISVLTLTRYVDSEIRRLISHLNTVWIGARRRYYLD